VVPRGLTTGEVRIWRSHAVAPTRTSSSWEGALGASPLSSAPSCPGEASTPPPGKAFQRRHRRRRLRIQLSRSVQPRRARKRRFNTARRTGEFGTRPCFALPPVTGAVIASFGARRFRP
jgi:hypothetical protein